MCRNAIPTTRSNNPKVSKQFEQVITHLQQTQQEKDNAATHTQTSVPPAVEEEVPPKQGEKRKRSAPSILSIIQRITRLEMTLLGEAKVGAIIPRLIALERETFGAECEASVPLKRIQALEENFLDL